MQSQHIMDTGTFQMKL